MSRKTSFGFFIVIISIFLAFGNLYSVHAHGGGPSEPDDHYQVVYSESDVSMRLSNIEIPLGGAYEKNVSITETNSSMTVIIEVKRNQGTVWGLYIENQSTYYGAKKGTFDPRIFCSSGLGLCCEKIFDHVSYYASAHITKPVGQDYVLALYNTHFHDEKTTIFDVIILNGHIGDEIYVLDPPTNDIFLSIIVLSIVTGIGIGSIGLVLYVLLIKPRRR